MKTPGRQRVARRVQPSGRPYGSPFGLDAPECLWHSCFGSRKSLKIESIQTPNHNLISSVFGLTLGDHFKCRATSANHYSPPICLHLEPDRPENQWYSRCGPHWGSDATRASTTQGRYQSISLPTSRLYLEECYL